MDYVLRTNNLSKKYKNTYVLKNVNMNIKKGDIYGFVGENGSGKTTIIRLITGLVSPTSGNYELFGVKNKTIKVLKARKKVGAVVESPSIYLNMTAKENLKMQADILGVKSKNKIKDMLKLVGLEDVINSKKKAGNFSLGMRQRLGIAMALIGDPEFLILDEPMNGLDPAGIVDLRELIIKLNKERNITFLISSHILTELSLVATKYGIISHGKMIEEISSEDLKNKCRKNVVVEVDNIELAKKEIAKITDSFDVLNNKITIYEEVDLNVLLSSLIKKKIKIDSINTNNLNIEDYYLSVIGGNKNV